MNNAKTLPIHHIQSSIASLGLKAFVNAGQLQISGQGVMLACPIQKKRYYPETLLNQFAREAKNASVPYDDFRRICYGDVTPGSNVQASDVAKPEKWKPLPKALSGRQMPYSRVAALFQGNDWDIVSKKGSHTGYAPNQISDFHGMFTFYSHGKKKPVLKAKQIDQRLYSLMKSNAHSLDGQQAILGMRNTIMADFKV